MNIVRRLNRLATAPGGASSDVNRLLLDAVSPSELEWSDFDHVARDRDHIEKLLEGALETSAPGVNVLLYGPPGTGKTEFCEALAERLGVTLYSVGESTDSRDEPLRNKRLQDLRLSQRLLARERRSLVLFDEMEDLLSDSFADFAFFGQRSGSRLRDGGSKVFMQRLLEQAPSPTLWIMNDARGVSPRHPAPHDVRLGVVPADGPGQSANLGAAARTSRGSPQGRRRRTRWQCNPRCRGRRHRGREARWRQHRHRAARSAQPVPSPVMRKAVATDTISVRPRSHPRRYRYGRARGASREQRRRAVLAVSPGTPLERARARTSHYLAERLDLELVHKRTSDLLSMWVGETEQRIAVAFAEARDTCAFLVFDEADSLLADRRFAQEDIGRSAKSTRC